MVAHKGVNMTGAELAGLMNNKSLNHAISKHARRYSSLVEDQEEYIQEAWLRISKQESGKEISFYENESRKATHALWKKVYRSRVDIKSGGNVHGNSIRGKWNPKKYISLGRGRYLKKERETLIGWYYHEEWLDLLYFRDGNYCILKSDADHHGIEYDESNLLDKSFAKKYRVNNIEVEV